MTVIFEYPSSTEARRSGTINFLETYIAE